jgi:hypothetical protein
MPRVASLQHWPTQFRSEESQSLPYEHSSNPTVLELMQHFLPTLRDGPVRAHVQRQIIEPTITFLNITIMAVEAVAREEGVGFERGRIRCVERTGS